MPRLRDTRTGVVVDVDDDTAGRLPAAYERVEEPRKATAKRSSSSKSKSD